jgi:hypothetical protein
VASFSKGIFSQDLVFFGLRYLAPLALFGGGIWHLYGFFGSFLLKYDGF